VLRLLCLQIKLSQRECAMNPVIHEWVHLAVRWFHVIAGIAWIGSSFFFMWLDSHLRPYDSAEDGIEGQLWMVHSGGFYHVDKFMVAPKEMPRDLHWFKWEAYATWWSGFFLLIVVYYLGGRGFLIDPSVSSIAFPTAVALGLASLALSWLVYDALCISPVGKNDRLLAIVGFGLLMSVAFGLSQVFSGRAAFIHCGAIMGTCMAFNVWRRIIPAQSQLVAATEQGKPRDPALGKAAKQRSVHNNYMTLPVVFVMISNHYPATYGHSYRWLVLGALIILGALVRHFFNLRNRGQTRYGVLVAALLLLIAIALATSWTPKDESSTSETVTFQRAKEIIDQRCVSCHSANPTDDIFVAAPNGVMLDTAERIYAYSNQIYTQAVISKVMPLGNKTGITDEERAELGRWYNQGAPTSE
jgi:uncharacterized membrane protein